ncbi:MAG: ankyrin repeat domain-containing protein [Granulosicoccaceae bacterium]
MTHSLPKKPSISLLKKQAKKLLKQVREGQPDALEFVSSNHPKPNTFAGLRDAQLVIARSYNFPGWVELSKAVEIAQDAARNLADKSTLFIQLGCVQYSGNDTLRNYKRARRLLASFPDIAQFSFFTALVANNAKAVRKHLESDSRLATSSGGPLGWPPILYAIYSRIGEPEGTMHSLSIVSQLLEYGASADSHLMLDGTYRFTALTGAMGEGEQGVNQPPHQYSDEMAAVLLDAGANPNDEQGLYNTMFTDSGDKWLALLISRGLKVDDPLNWNDPNRAAHTSTLDFQLSSAVDTNRASRVKMLLNAGANPNARSNYNGKAIHTNALLAGHAEITQLLNQAGALVEDLDFRDQFQIACVQENDQIFTSLLDAHPELKNDSTLLHAAAENASDRVVMELISLGFDVNGQSKHGRTLLHSYALKNDTARIKDLLHLGARTDILDTSHNSSAAGFAAYAACYDTMRVLLDSHDSLLDVACCAYLERAKAIVKKTPASIGHRTERGNSVLHIIGAWLHEEPE